MRIKNGKLLYYGMVWKRACDVYWWEQGISLRYFKIGGGGVSSIFAYSLPTPFAKALRARRRDWYIVQGAQKIWNLFMKHNFKMSLIRQPKINSKGTLSEIRTRLLTVRDMHTVFKT
jgi:hypothetical protein